MKIVHVSTSTGGGAGIAARRLHRALLKSGHDSSLLHLSGAGNEPNEVQFKLPVSFIRRVINFVIRTFHFPSNAIKFQKILNTNPNDTEIFSLPYSENRVENHPLIKSADIIHLHWISGFINYKSFFYNCRKPIVWTFHDMNPFLGGAHYEGDLNLNIAELDHLEVQLKKIKDKIIQSHNSLSVVFLNKWMQSKAEKHNFNHSGKLTIIPNCIDFGIFSILDQNICRTKFNFCSDKTIFLIIAENLMNKRKGTLELIEVLSGLEYENTEFVFVGGNSIDTKNIHPCMKLGEIRNEKTLNELYNAVDYLIIPSKEDNLPNIMLEALAVGCKVISTKNGGMAECIQNDYNGFLIDDIVDIKNLIPNLTRNNNPKERAHLRSVAMELFDESSVTSKMLSFYDSIFEVKKI